MKFITAKAHGVLDYVVVLLFSVAPTLFHFSTLPATISYALAGVHLALTLFTNFPLGIVKLVPFTLHGYIEALVGPCLVILPFVLRLTAETPALIFYVVCGIVIFSVWLLTNYKSN